MEYTRKSKANDIYSKNKTFWSPSARKVLSRICKLAAVPSIEIVCDIIGSSGNCDMCSTFFICNIHPWLALAWNQALLRACHRKSQTTYQVHILNQLFSIGPARQLQSVFTFSKVTSCPSLDYMLSSRAKVAMKCDVLGCKESRTLSCQDYRHATYSVDKIWHQFTRSRFIAVWEYRFGPYGGRKKTWWVPATIWAVSSSMTSNGNDEGGSRWRSTQSRRTHLIEISQVLCHKVWPRQDSIRLAQPFLNVACGVWKKQLVTSLRNPLFSGAVQKKIDKHR